MSKCDFYFEFERADRTYRSNEKVRGRVTVVVNKTVDCRDLKLTGLWRTHGRGNRAQGEYHSTSLYQGQLTAGERHSYDFEFQIPPQPVTYHGNLINVDHYVSMRADIPWAFDATGETEFIVLLGYESPVSDAPLATFTQSSSLVGMIFGTIIALVFMGVGLFLLPFYGLGVIPIAIGLGILFFAFRNRLAERKLGPVECVIAPSTQVPGGELGVRISFSPRQSGSITKIVVGMRGTETAVSGSGTNKTTHRHKLHESQQTAAESLQLIPGQSHTVEHFIACPETSAYTIKLGENSIDWVVHVRLDIPRWPDWVMEVPVQIVPLLAANDPAMESSPRGEAEPSDSGSVAHAPHGDTALAYDDEPSGAMVAEPYSAAAPQAELTENDGGDIEDSPSIASPSAPPSSRSLQAVAEQLIAAERYSSRRTEIVESMQGELFQVTLEIERSSSTFGVYDDPQYRSGQTLIGTLDSTDIPVAIQFRESQNEVVRGLAAHTTWSGTVRINRWDDLYDRLELRTV